MNTPHNPYAPPAAQEQAPTYAPTLAAEPQGLSLSDRGWELVAQMAKWMRIVSVFMFIFSGLIILAAILVSFASMASEPWNRIPIPPYAIGGGLLIVGVLTVFAGVWLRGAATRFYEGVLSDSPTPLALGFRKLRLYLIIYGLWNILLLGFTIAQLVIPALD